MSKTWRFSGWNPQLAPSIQELLKSRLALAGFWVIDDATLVDAGGLASLNGGTFGEMTLKTADGQNLRLGQIDPVTGVFTVGGDSPELVEELLRVLDQTMNQA